MSSHIQHCNHLKGFVKLNKSKNPRKTRKRVGGSSPNSDFYLFSKFCVFLCSFRVSKCFKKKKKHSRVGVWCLTNPSFSRILGFFSNLERLLTHTIVSIICYC